VQQVAAAGEDHVDVGTGSEEGRQGLDQDLESLLGCHPAHPEKERCRGWNPQPCPPGGARRPVWRVGSESPDVHAVGDDPRPLGRKAQGADALDQLRRAAGEERRPAEGETGERPRSRLFGQEDVAAVEADGEGRRPPAGSAGQRHPVGDQEMGLDEVEAPPRQKLSHRPPRRQGVEGGDEGGLAAHPLVGRKSAAVAQDLPGGGSVAEGDHLHPLTIPAALRRQPLAVGDEDGHPVAAAHQGARQVAKEGTAVSSSKRGRSG